MSRIDIIDHHTWLGRSFEQQGTVRISPRKRVELYCFATQVAPVCFAPSDKNTVYESIGGVLRLYKNKTLCKLINQFLKNSYFWGFWHFGDSCKFNGAPPNIDLSEGSKNKSVRIFDTSSKVGIVLGWVLGWILYWVGLGGNPNNPHPNPIQKSENKPREVPLENMTSLKGHGYVLDTPRGGRE